MKKCLLILGLIPFVANAHGSFASLSRTVGPYILEFEYNGTVIAGDYILFRTYLLNAEDRKAEDYNFASIRIEKIGGAEIYNANIVRAPQGDGFADMSMIIADPGLYKADVSYFKNSKELANASFDFVAQQKQVNLPPYKQVDVKVLAGIGVVCLAVAFGIFLGRQGRKKA